MITYRPLTITIAPVALTDEARAERPACTAEWTATYTAAFLDTPLVKIIRRWENSPEDRAVDRFGRDTVYTIDKSLQDFWSLESAAMHMVERLENQYRGYDILATFEGI